MKKLFVLLAAVLLVFGLTACSNSSADTTPADTTPADAGLSGSIQLNGSTSMKKLCDAMAESFMAANPDVTVSVEYTGSGAGLEALAAGTTDIGDSSRHLKDSEVAAGAVENVVAIDGIAVIVDPANTVTGLTKQQLTDIYTGTVSNWKEVGGDDAAIVVIGRESGSGTRSAFEEILGVADACAYAQELSSTGEVLKGVATTPYAIGYVSLDVVDSSVIAVELDGVAATEANIVAGNYFLSRPFVMATNGAIAEQNELVQAWFEYVYSAEGAAIVKSVGLIVAQ
ncbi:MAG: phosphate ABC transporter substrate-binding protein [Erysipelotrichaceae bacterium]|nr:phosphate ABC transporter substrate-binding protein [Erysipelotrichaceae bacterium]